MKSIDFFLCTLYKKVQNFFLYEPKKLCKLQKKNTDGTYIKHDVKMLRLSQNSHREDKL